MNLQITIVSLYIVLIIFNLSLYVKNRISRKLALFSFFLLLFLMCGYQYGSGKYYFDLDAYYVEYNILFKEQANIGLYYIFYALEAIGSFLSLPFYSWWVIMTLLSFVLLLFSIKKFNLNPHLFLFFFMVYFVFIFYTGLKLYYGFCVFQIGFLYLLRSKKGDKWRYVFLTCVAGGFQVMYYAFLVFLIINSKRQKTFIKILCVCSLIFSIFILLNGKNIPYLQNIMSLIDTDKINRFLLYKTNNGYLLSIVMQLATLFYAWQYRKIVAQKNDCFLLTFANTLLYSNMLMVLFYPLFMIAVTFMRLVTSISICTIMASSNDRRIFMQRERVIMILSGMIIIVGFFFISFVINGYWDYTVVPFFSSFYIQ